MTLHHSEETHRALVARIPEATGRDIKEWFTTLEQGPAFSRFDDKVTWLKGEFDLGHGHAMSIYAYFKGKRS